MHEKLPLFKLGCRFIIFIASSFILYCVASRSLKLSIDELLSIGFMSGLTVTGAMGLLGIFLSTGVPWRRIAIPEIGQAEISNAKLLVYDFFGLFGKARVLIDPAENVIHFYNCFLPNGSILIPQATFMCSLKDIQNYEIKSKRLGILTTSGVANIPLDFNGYEKIVDFLKYSLSPDKEYTESKEQVSVERILFQIFSLVGVIAGACFSPRQASDNLMIIYMFAGGMLGFMVSMLLGKLGDQRLSTGFRRKAELAFFWMTFGFFLLMALFPLFLKIKGDK